VKRYSIRAVYAVLVCGTIALTATAFTIILGRQAARATHDLQSMLFAQVAAASGNHLSGYFAQGVELLDELVYAAAREPYPQRDPESLARLFAERLRFRPNLAWISWSDAEHGRFAGAWRDPDGHPVINLSDPRLDGGLPREWRVEPDGSLSRLTRDLRPYDPRTRSFFTGAAATTDIYWSDLTAFHEGRTGITAARAVRDADGTLTGVVTVDFFLETMRHFLVDVRPALDSEVFLFHRDAVITASGHEPTGLVAAARRAVTLDGSPATVPARHDTRPYLVSVLTLPDYLDGRWCCALASPRDQLETIVASHRHTAYALLALLTLALLGMGGLFAYWIARPLRRVTAEIADVACGRFDPDRSPFDSRLHEVNHLHDAIGHMKECLRERDASNAARIQAEQTSRDKQDFAAMISHEIRNPTQILLGLTELLQQPTLDETTRRAYLRDLHAGALALHELINNLLHLFKLDAGRYEVHREEIHLNHLLQDVTSHLSDPDRPTVALRVLPAPGDPRLATDPVMLRQIITNLLTNALKFTHTGDVTLAARIENNQAVITVRDTGIGMTEHEVAHIFAAYCQAHPGIAHSYGGTGLGLAICHRFTTLLGGTITCTSKKNEGSTFTITLPVAPVTI
jgi:signal transduction histidine kinase